MRSSFEHLIISVTAKLTFIIHYALLFCLWLQTARRNSFITNIVPSDRPRIVTASVTIFFTI
jgi:hypothetical protein